VGTNPDLLNLFGRGGPFYFLSIDILLDAGGEK